MEEIHLKIDSKGRICIPPEIREQIGENVAIKKTPEGFLLIPGKPVHFLEQFRQIVSSEPNSKGKPKLTSPQKMKNIWRTTT